MTAKVFLLAFLFWTGAVFAEAPSGEGCKLVEEGYGPAGEVAVRAETVVSGLEVPWGVAFLPGGDLLITERPGRLRLVRDGTLEANPVAVLRVSDGGEGGLLGIALSPEFDENRLFYLYYTTEEDGSPVNRVDMWRLSEDHRSATPERVLLDGIPAARLHNGGRLRIGPDGMLYIATGDSREPQEAQRRSSLSGKLLRLTPEGQIPDDNPFADSPVFLIGLRNPQGFDWPERSSIWMTDHGPSGELGRSGHDEVTVAQAGDDLGWPTVYGCQGGGDLVKPSLTWKEAVPPGGAAIYTGNAISEWKGSLLIGTLESTHLHRVVFDRSAPPAVARHEVYFEGDPPRGFGRLREVMMGPDGNLYVTTSNCDGRGSCPPDRDKLLRIISGE